MRRLCLIVWIGLGWLLTACQTLDDGPIVLDTIQSRQDVITVPYTLMDSGLILLPVRLSEKSTDIDYLIMDTGATRSALYRKKVRALELEQVGNAPVQLFGMVETGMFPEVTIPFFKMGTMQRKNLSVLSINNRDFDAGTTPLPVGLIGMDILKDYRIYFDPMTQLISFIPLSVPAPEFGVEWDKIEIVKNPYTDRDWGLGFIKMRFTGALIPALIDTGSEFNIMNWKAVRSPRLNAMRRRMRDSWELQGAVGKFDPTLKAKVGSFRAGQKFWKDREFIVMGFDSLHVLSANENPFVIAGVDLFVKSPFWLDLKAGQLLIKTDRNVTFHEIDRTLKIKRIYPTRIPAGTVLQGD